MRIRACGIVIRDGQVLMVRHVHDGRDYWTLPGGGMYQHETEQEAAKREVLEETGIDVDAVKVLFSYEASTSISHCVLMTSPGPCLEPVLGADPEEAHLPVEQRMLREVAWHEIDSLQDHPLIARAIVELGLDAITSKSGRNAD